METTLKKQERAHGRCKQTLPTTGNTNGVMGRNVSTSSNSSGVFGTSEAPTGNTSGVVGITRSSTDSASGVRGIADGPSGETFGVYGTTNSDQENSSGVKGEYLETTGNTNGVYGFNSSITTNATGVKGEANGDFGKVYGVRGICKSTTDSAAGVVGITNADGGQTFGVSGKSGNIDEKSSGVHAEGAGAFAAGSPNAAALDISNGAIRVSGTARPAGMEPFAGPWAPIYTCPYTGNPFHMHFFAYRCNVTITNALIKPDSYILITARFSDLPTAVYSAELTMIGAGTATAAVSFFGSFCPTPAEAGTLFYLIINHD